MSTSAPPERHRRRRTRSRRLLATTVSLALASSVLGTLAPSAGAIPAGGSAINALQYRDGTGQKRFGPNSVIMIDGSIEYDGACFDGGEGGIADFFYPATDVYVVPAGSASLGSELVDAAGVGPNTIVAVTSGAFLDELIAVTSPGGQLGSGVYDVVYDTCQDGQVGPEDEVFDEAITVELPAGDLPPVPNSIGRLKEKAKENFALWSAAHDGMSAAFKADKAVQVLECAVTFDLACLAETILVLEDMDKVEAPFNDEVEERALNLILNVAKNHGAIYRDPPDDQFRQPTLLGPVVHDAPASTGTLADGVGALVAPLADEQALTQALLHAIERYQGAQAAGDTAWALAHAREAADLSAALQAVLTDSTAVADLGAALRARPGYDAVLTEGRAVARRFSASGFTPAEEQHLRNAGLSEQDVRAAEATWVEAAPPSPITTGELASRLTALATGRAELASALQEQVTTWDGVVSALQARGATGLPVADAGGPRTTPAGQAVLLDAAGSSAGSYAWDLDADGQFDDASGAQTSRAFDASTVVGLRVTDAAGRAAVSYTRVTVTGADRPAAITAATPARSLAVEAGAVQRFSVTASDPDGDQLTYAWSVDGTSAGSPGAVFDWATSTSDVGRHLVTVTVTGDGPARSSRSWLVSVRRSDTDGDGWVEGVDCDDTRADRHPGGTERVGNGQDDDCDPGTPDAPPAGLRGTPYTWGDGQGTGLGLGPDVLAPAPLTSLGEVADVESGHAKGFAVTGDGTVRAWGLGYRGVLGSGSEEHRYVPGPVVGLDGAPELAGARDVEVDSDHGLALRTDGVVAWGAGGSGQLGDGSVTPSQLTPVRVAAAPGTDLAGARDVEVGESSSYAVLADGQVADWGTVACDADGARVTTRLVAAVNPRFGDGVVQLESGDSGWVLARKADGSVWACGQHESLLDRSDGGLTGTEIATPRVMRSFGRGSGVVDVSAGAYSGVALREDGTVLAWGRNVNGQLDVIGVPPGGSRVVPTRVPLPAGPPVVDVEHDDSERVLATRADGSVLVWGSNANGGAGVGSTVARVSVATPIDLDGRRAVQTATSDWNSTALTRPADDPGFEWPAQWVGLSVADTAFDEAAGGAFTATLTQPAPFPLTVTWAVGDGPARTAQVPAGQSSVQLPVTVVDDALDEPDSTLAVQVSAVSHGVRVVDGTASATVRDDDAPPVVTIAGEQVDEGGTSLTDAQLAVTLSTPSGRDVEVFVETVDGTATAPSDYTASRASLLIPAGATTAKARVAVVGDAHVEPDEHLTVRLADPVHAVLGTSSARLDVRDDEPLVVRATAPSVTEGDSGTTTAEFSVSVTAPPTGVTVTVPWSLAAGTAEVGADVVAATGTLELTAAARSGPVRAQVVADTVPEDLPVEVFRLVLAGAVASDGRPVVVDDPAPARIVEDDEAQEPQPSWPFDGFFAPVDNAPVVNVVKAGSTVPLKFGLGGDRGLAIFAPGFPSSVRHDCGGAAQDELESTSTPGSSALTYDAATGRYHYNWQTDRAWGKQCRTLVLRFADGSERTAEFRFR